MADAFRRHGWAVRAPNVLRTAAAPNDHYGALFIDAKWIESAVQIQLRRISRAGGNHDRDNALQLFETRSDLIADFARSEAGQIAGAVTHR
jgi:hypothetical protein